jgi:lysophospholipase L1-like esterase
VWTDILARRAHEAFGAKVSIVNAGIGGNTVIADSKLDVFRYNHPAVQRLDRDVLTISGLTAVIWLEGVNDLGAGQIEPEPLMAGYRNVVERLHERSVAAIGVTVLPSLWPEPSYDRINQTAPKLLAELLPKFGGVRVDARRRRVNEFIRYSGLFDSVIDMAAAMENPETGALYEHFQIGDYLHPNRAGRIAMARAVELSTLKTKYRRAGGCNDTRE